MKRLKLSLSLLALFVMALAVHFMIPVNAYFYDTETVSCRISAGTWETGSSVRICKVCPDWGKAGACRWPVFIHGEGFYRGARAALALGDFRVEALKNWFLGEKSVYAVFDLRGARVGIYDVLLYWPDGRRAVFPGGFRVVAGCSSSLAGTVFSAAGEGALAGDRALTGPTGSGPSPDGGAERGDPAAESGKSSPATGEGALVGSSSGALLWLAQVGGSCPGSLRLVSSRPLGCGVARACAVAPGLYVEGVVTTRPNGTVALSFDLGTPIPDELEVVLFTPLGEPLFIEP
jgi:hypothetical protein